MTLGWKLKMSSLVLRSTMLRRARLVLAESEKALREDMSAHIRAANFKGGAEALGDADMLMCELEAVADTDDEVRDILSSTSDLSELEDEAVLLAWSTREWAAMKLSRLLGWEKGESSVGGYPGW